MLDREFLTAAEAATELGVSLGTVYAYVSRGLLRSEMGAGSKRSRRYLVEDVQRLQSRKEQRRDPDRALQSALDWGAPVLESRLTKIAGGKLYYRGQQASALARSRSFEQVATLLWTGDASISSDLFRHDRPAPEIAPAKLGLVGRL